VSFSRNTSEMMETQVSAGPRAARIAIFENFLVGRAPPAH
jgi:hypothetical protein